VEIKKERSFRGKDKPPTALWYRSTSRIDRSRGLMVDSSGASETEEGPVTVRIHLLEGDELKQAVDQANSDWADRPAEIDPVEFRRVRINIDSPRHFKSSSEVKPSMAVAIFRDDDRKWYLGQVLEVVKPGRNEIRIRYQGSNEEKVVQLGNLA